MNYIDIDDNLNPIQKINDLNEEIQDTPNEKIIIPKKNYYCSNCNRKGHFFKNCLEPII